MADIAELEAAHLVAKVALANAENALRNERGGEIRLATEEIGDRLNLKHAPHINECRKNAHEALDALNAARIEAGNGRLAEYPSGVVVEWARARDSFGRRYPSLTLTGRRGCYEVRTPETQFSAGIGEWRTPLIGHVFVRLLKKDGSPGLGFAQISGDWRPEGAPEPAQETER